VAGDILGAVAVPVAFREQGSGHRTLPDQLAPGVEQVEVARLLAEGDFEALAAPVEIAQGDVLGVANALSAIVDLQFDPAGERLDDVDGSLGGVAAFVVVDQVNLSVAVHVAVVHEVAVVFLGAVFPQHCPVAAKGHGQLLPVGEDLVQPVAVDVASAHLVGVGGAASELRVMRPDLPAHVVVAVENAPVSYDRRPGLLVQEMPDHDVALPVAAMPFHAVPERSAPFRLSAGGIDAPQGEAVGLPGRMHDGETSVAVQVEHRQTALVA